MGFDIAIGIILLLGAIRGFKKGFARQVLTLFSLLVAFLFAEPVANRLQPLTQGLVKGQPADVAESMVFTGTLLLLFLAINGLGTLYLYVYRTRTLGVNVPSLQDRVVGVVVGTVVAGFVACVMISLYDNVPAMLREINSVKAHYASSRSVKLAEQFRVADRVWETREVQRAYLHAGRLINYYRPSQDTANALLSVPGSDQESSSAQ